MWLLTFVSSRLEKTSWNNPSGHGRRQEQPPSSRTKQLGRLLVACCRSQPVESHERACTAEGWVLLWGLCFVLSFLWDAWDWGQDKTKLVGSPEHPLLFWFWLLHSSLLFAFLFSTWVTWVSTISAFIPANFFFFFNPRESVNWDYDYIAVILD